MNKRIILALSVLFLVCMGVAAQSDLTTYNPSFDEGDIAIQAGLGLFPAGIYGDITIPPIFAAVDYALPIADLPISVGGIVGMMRSEEQYFDWSWSYTYVLIGARAAYHFNLGVERLDPYAGLTLGYNIVNVSEDSDYTGDSFSAGSSYLLFGGHIGTRYFFNENFAIFGELGYGVGVLTLGGAYRI